MRSILLTFSLFFSFLLVGQKKYFLTFTTNDYSVIKKNIESKFTDSLQAKNYLQKIQITAIKKGYVLASIDTIRYLKNELKASFYLGPKFGNAHLNLEENDLRYFKQYMKVNEKFFTNATFSPHQIAAILKKINSTLENNGYPLAKVHLDKIKIEGTHLQANIVIQKNELFKWTEIHIKGDSSISNVFLSNIIRIKPGDKYNQEELIQITKRLKQINFIKEIKPHEILFTKNGAELFLYVKSNPISSINGVIGLQPNPKTNRVDFTGDISLKLLNTIKRGELLELNWKSMQTQTQSLKGRVNYPFLFKTPFGIDGQFNLYKRDTTYLELKSTIGIQYFLKGGNYLKVFYQNSSSNILSGGTNNPNFTNLGTVHSNGYGLAILRKQVDYIPNPSRGFILNTEVSIGTRKSRTTDTSKVIINNTYRSDISLEFFIPLAKRHVVRFASQTDFYFAPKIFENEVTRFGGLISQRGFNEEELYATTKSLMSFEYRFLVDQNSRAFLFYDQSWYENNAVKYYKDHPFGFGAGFSFGTNIGIFSISYAQGKQYNNPILIKNGKVHFGYVAYF
jgi:outer membrane protein assembly factor BamA